MLKPLVYLAIFVAAFIGFAYLMWTIHLGLDRICAFHSRRFCRHRGLTVSRLRVGMAMEKNGSKSEFSWVELDCIDSRLQRKLIKLFFLEIKFVAMH